MNPADGWERILLERWAVFGHRNWIAIADTAYPVQSLDASRPWPRARAMPEVLSCMLACFDATPHVNATAYIDQELRFVAKEDAPSVSQFRGLLQQSMGSRGVHEAPHWGVARSA